MNKLTQKRLGEFIMKNFKFKYFALTILSVFLISEISQAQRGRGRGSKPSSRTAESGRSSLPSVPERSTDSVRSFILTKDLERFKMNRSQMDNLLVELERQGITRDQIREMLTSNFGPGDFQTPPLNNSFFNYLKTNSDIVSLTTYNENPLLIEIARRSVRWAVTESITTDMVHSEILEIARDLKRQGRSLSTIDSLLETVGIFYEDSLSQIDSREPGALTRDEQMIRPEDLEVARLIIDALRWTEVSR